MPITTANTPKALAGGARGYLGGGDWPLQRNVIREPQEAHNALPSASRNAQQIPGMAKGLAHHNCGGPAFPCSKRAFG